MNSKEILVGLLIGVIVGGVVVYAITPHEDSAYQAQIEEIENTIQELNSQMDELEEESSSLRGENHRLEAELRQALEIETDYDKLLSDYQQLEEVLSSLQNEFLRAVVEPVAPFTVQGKHVYDKFGRRVAIKGFSLDQVMYSGGRQNTDPYTKDDLQRIKDWGFHFVYSQLWWGMVELDQDQEGVYDYQYILEDYNHVIDWADEVGLNWIFRFRVSFNDDISGTEDGWWGWPTAAYVCTEEGLERYCDFLKTVISYMESEHDNIVAYQPWQFPFHQSQYSDEQEDFFFERVLPEMVYAVRSVTSKPIILSPTHPIFGVDVDFVDLINFDDRLKVDDTNVIYSFSYYDPVRHGALTSEDQEIWEGTPSDIDHQEELLAYATSFSNKYDVPLNVFEFGIKMEREDQLDKMRLKLELLDEQDIGWAYWWYSWWEDQYVSFNLCYPDGTPKQDLLDLLIEYSEWMYW